MAGVGGILANIFGGIKNVVAGRRPGYRGPGERPAVTTLREKPQTRRTPQSSWITALRWEPGKYDPNIGKIIMMTKGSSKEYTFQAQPYDAFEDWYEAISPGKKYWTRFSAGRGTLTAKKQQYDGRPKAAAKAKAKAQFKRQYMRSAARTTRPGGGG